MGVQVPLGHMHACMLTYMLTAHARGRTCPGAPHLIEGHSLISIRQEHDISALVLSTVTGDHEPDNALTWHSFSPRHRPFSPRHRRGLTYTLPGALAEIADSAHPVAPAICAGGDAPNARFGCCRSGQIRLCPASRHAPRYVAVAPPEWLLGERVRGCEPAAELVVKVCGRGDADTVSEQRVELGGRLQSAGDCSQNSAPETGPSSSSSPTRPASSNPAVNPACP